MKDFVKRTAERIDAATLRERVLIFLALSATLVFLVNFLVIEPLRATQKRLATETSQRQKELQTVQEQIARMLETVQVDPDAPSRARLTALRDEFARLDGRVVEEQRRFTPPEQMRAMLEEMLRRNRGLALIDLKSLPVAPVGGGNAGAGTLYRHGLEFTVTGSYVDLYEYLRSLESMPTQLYWRRAELSVSSYPLVTLKVTAFTVSFDRAWLIV